jgi:putative peptidoglycan lipid II flippase
MLVAYIVALPAYIGTELVTRGLIALRDTTTPLMTNCAQLAGRAGLIMLLLGPLGAVAIPIAFTISSVGEALILGAVLWVKLRRRNRRTAEPQSRRTQN